MVEGKLAAPTGAGGLNRRRGFAAESRLATLALVIGSLCVSCLLSCASPAFAARKETKQTITILYRDEMRKAPEKLKWRGERLSDDTLYAVALTGASWEPELGTPSAGPSRT